MSAVRNRRQVEQVNTAGSNHSGSYVYESMVKMRTPTKTPEKDIEMEEIIEPLMVEQAKEKGNLPMGTARVEAANVSEAFEENNNSFYYQGLKLLFCFSGLQASYLTWGYMQELIMTTLFTPTENVPDGKFPSAAFCVFSNRFLAVIVGAIACRVRHGAFFANNKAPLIAFAPCALSNTMSSWSQYASLKYVAFPVQTVFKSSKIIPVMIMGRFLKGTTYPIGQYVEAFLITVGVAIFSLSSKTSNSDNGTEIIGLIFMLMYISFDSFTSQWQSKIYEQYGKSNVDQYQMMLSVNTWAITITTIGLIVTGDFPVVIEFLRVNPVVLNYNIITAITSATGQLFIFYTIKEFGPIVFTVIMTTRQLFSITLSCIIFGHAISLVSFLGASMVFSVIFFQIRRKYLARIARS